MILFILHTSLWDNCFSHITICLKIIESKLQNIMKQESNIISFTMSSFWLYHFLAFKKIYFLVWENPYGFFFFFFLAKLSQTAQVMSSRKLTQKRFFPRKAILFILSWFLIFQIKKNQKPKPYITNPQKKSYFQFFSPMSIILGWIS